jgi:hypothetical protein
MSFLYDEDDQQQHRALDSHCGACPECAAHLKELRNGMHALDTWKLPQPRAAATRPPVLRWAAAAALLLAAGIGIGRLGAPNANAVRNAMQIELESRLAAARLESQQSFVALLKDLDQKREAETANLLVTLKQMDARRAAEAARLRRDLDTVAVVSDARLSQTQEQLDQLTNPTQPEDR